MEPQNDHDLLIELRTEVKAVRSDIKEIKEGTAARLIVLENDHVTKEEFKDHELRLRRIELWGAVAIGLSYAAQFYFNFLRK